MKENTGFKTQTYEDFSAECDRKKFTVKVRMEIEYEFYAKNAREAYEQSQNVEIPSWYVDNSWDTQWIYLDWKEVENWDEVMF